MAEARTITSADLSNAVPGAVTEQLPNGDLVIAREKLIEFSIYLRDQAGYDYSLQRDRRRLPGLQRPTDANRFEVVYHVLLHGRTEAATGGPACAPASDPTDSRR